MNNEKQKMKYEKRETKNEERKMKNEKKKWGLTPHPPKDSRSGVGEWVSEWVCA